MKLTDIDSVPMVVVDMDGAEDVKMQIPIGAKDGTPAYSMRIFTLGPKGHTPFHSHPFEHLNYVISGRGTLYGKDCHRGIGAGDCILVKPNEMHQYKNSSAKSAFVFICLVPKENECGCPDKEEENEEVQS